MKRPNGKKAPPMRPWAPGSSVLQPFALLHDWNYRATMEGGRLFSDLLPEHNPVRQQSEYLRRAAAIASSTLRHLSAGVLDEVR